MKKYILFFLSLILILQPVNIVAAIDLGDNPPHPSNEPGFIAIQLSQNSHTAGTVGVVGINVTTQNIPDGSVLTAQLINSTDSIPVSGVNAATGTTKNNVTNISLTIPSGISAGTYKIKLSEKSLNVYDSSKTYTINQSIPSILSVTSSSSSNIQGVQNTITLDIITENVSNDTQVKVNLVDLNGDQVTGVSATGTITNNKAQISMVIPPTVLSGEYRINVSILSLSKSNLSYTVYPPTNSAAISSISVDKTTQTVGTAQEINVTVNTTLVNDNTALSIELKDSNENTKLSQSGKIFSNKANVKLTIPNTIGVGTYQIVVSVTGITDPKYQSYTVIQPNPIITNVATTGANLTEGQVSGNISISGNNFSSVTNNNRVDIINTETNELITATVTTASTNSLITIIPSTLKAGTYKIKVTIGGQSIVSTSTFKITSPTTPPNNGGTPVIPGGGGGLPGSGSDTPGSNEDTANKGDVEKRIEANQGGVAEIENEIKIVVPKNAFNSDTNLLIKLSDTPPTTNKTHVIVSDVYDITVEKDVKFLDSLTITFSYDTTKVKDASKLGIYYYHETRKQWVYVGGVIDKNNGTISTQVDHFTKFTVIENQNFVYLKDMDKHWGKQYVNNLMNMGIINGVKVSENDYNYYPDNNITREEFAKLIALALNLNTNNPINLPFEDADKIQTWAKPYVQAVYDANIIKGSVGKDNKLYFNPSNKITRAEMATIIGRAINTTSNTELLFKDKDTIPTWAAEYVKIAVDHKIISGYNDNTFRPNNPATRAESAKMIWLLLEELN